MLYKLIKSDPFLYNLWFELYRKRHGVKINYFSPETRYLLDGYPRSGNTFSLSLVKKFFGKDNILHHFHAVAPIKIAFRKNIPVFILLRNPEDAITSYYLKEFALMKKSIPDNIDIKLLKTLTDQYVFYYNFVKNNLSRLTIIEFKKLIAAPTDLLEVINENVFGNQYKFSSEEVNAAANSFNGATDTYGSSRPNEQKEKIKNQLKEELIKLKAYKKARVLFDELNAG